MSNKKDLITFAFLAGSGGLARFLIGRMETDAPIISRGKFIFLGLANIFVSAFAGIMGALSVAAVAPENIIFQMAAAGVFGFMGQRGLEMLAQKLTDKI